MRRLSRLVTTLFPAGSRLGNRLRYFYYLLAPGKRRSKIPIVLEAFARSVPDAFFIQIGANDGDEGDPLKPYILPLQWRGITIEPQPHVFERLASRYQNNPHVIAECAAIASSNGARPFYYLQPSNEPNMPWWYDQVASFDRAHLLKHSHYLPGLEDRIRCREVPCLTFESLLKRHGVTHFDLLQVDAEGYDYEILKMAELHQHQPALILYEHRHLSYSDQNECQDMLRAAGYHLVHDRFDTVAIHQNVLAKQTSPLGRIGSRL